jgi:hypothetical protein
MAKATVALANFGIACILPTALDRDLLRGMGIRPLLAAGSRWNIED